MAGINGVESRRPGLSALLILIVVWTASSVIAGTKGEAPDCTKIILKVSLTAGQSYQQSIGGNFTLDILPNSSLTPPNGWTFTLDGPSGEDYAAPVNPPLRFNPTQILGPAYGFTARDSLKIDRRIRFILDEADYRRIEQLWQDALWPSSAPDRDNAADNYVTAIKRLRAGWLRVRTLQSDISQNNIVRSATFSFELTVPSDFELDPTLEPKRVACPAE